MKYSEAGLYILPIQPGTKHPGSVVGSGWPELSSNNTKQIEEWFTDTSYGIALHAGRSGLIIFDVDHPDSMPQVLVDAIAEYQPPIQESRPGRAHYLFTQPVGRMLGNSAGALARGWGEVRGKNGVIIVSPTIHPEGFQYQWLHTGPCPHVPPSIAQHIAEAGPYSRAVNSIDVDKFLEEFNLEKKPHLLKNVTRRYTDKVLLKTFSRHEAMLDHLCWAFQEAKAGFYPAKTAYKKLLEVFLDSLRDDESGSGRKIDAWQAEKEFQGLVKWAIGQVKSISDSKLHERSERLDAIDEQQKIKEAVENEKFRLKVKEAARREIGFEGWTPPLEGGRLDEVLTQEYKTVPHRIDGLGKIGGNTTLAGQYKAGKTTVEQNLIRSLADNVPFLGRDVITPLEGNVAVFNYELDSDEFADWLRELGIVNQKKVLVQNLRGVNLPLMSDFGAEWTSKYLRAMEVEYWIIDPAVRALSRQGDEVSNSDVSAFTEQLDNIKANSGVRDLLLLTHTGRQDGSRTRGASRWDDWPDSLWSLVKRNGKRFFSAIGRKVDVEEFELRFDRKTNRLSPAEGGKVNHDDFIYELAQKASEEIKRNPGKKSDYYEFKLSGTMDSKISSEDKREALEKVISLGLAHTVVGNLGGTLYFPPKISPDAVL